MRTMDHQMDDGWEREPARGMGSHREMAPEHVSNQPSPAPPPQDLTLGMTALMGIFLVAVLVCAVFFGFGYSTGRTLHGTKHAESGATVETSPAADDASVASKTPPLATAQPAVKPSAGAPLTDAAPGDPSAAQPSDEPAEAAGFPPPALARHSAAPVADSDEDVAPAPSVSARPTTPRATAVQPAASATSLPPSAPSAGSGGGVMVQIAAVARPADAQMLAQALRTNGYAALVRTEPQDKFLHVQVGPFATRDQAKAMRARLQAAGYNAFLKP